MSKKVSIDDLNTEKYPFCPDCLNNDIYVEDDVVKCCRCGKVLESGVEDGEA